MEDREEVEEGYDDSDIQEHGPELWFSDWERQCLSDSERREPGEPSESDHEQPDRLWHLFQTSATAVAQLYKDPGCHQHHQHYHQHHQGALLWVPFQNAAAAVTNLYKESAEARRRSFELGVQAGRQRRDKELLSWAKKRRRTLRREDLIGFLCGKAPPPRNSKNNNNHPWLAVNRPASDTASSQPLREANVALQALSGAMASITVHSGAPGSPTHGSRGLSGGSGRDAGAAAGGGVGAGGSGAWCRAASSAGWGGARKRNHTQCGSDAFAPHVPTYKRSRI